MASDLEDYYTILELDLDASPESVKLAYRRLARENHPDRKANLADTEQMAAAARMAQVNAAYAVLSNSKRKREYDDRLRTYKTLELRGARATIGLAEEARSATAGAGRVRPGAEVSSAVVHEFSSHLCTELVSNHNTFRWRQKKLEGFDWSLEARFLSSYYCVALRGFGAGNLASAKKFTNYASLAIAHCRPYLRRCHFLFLFPFQQLSDTEQVFAHCRQFASAESRTNLSSTQTLIVLLDVRHARSLPCGSQMRRDKRFDKLLEQLAISRT